FVRPSGMNRGAYGRVHPCVKHIRFASKLTVATFGAFFLWWLVLARVHRQALFIRDDCRLALCAVPNRYRSGKDSLSGDYPVPVERLGPIDESLFREGGDPI